MSDVTEDGLSNEPAVEGDALDHAIQAAMADPVDTSDADNDDDSAADQRARDERGRFAAKEPAAEAPEGSADAAKPADVQAEPEVQPAQAQPIELPARWTAEQKAEISKLPPEAQRIVADRYREMEGDYTRKTQEIAEFRRHAEPLLQAVQPFQQYLTQIGTNPAQAVQALFSAEYNLRTGTPEQKVQALAKVASDYGIDLAAMSRGEGYQPDPLVNQLHQRNQALEARLNQIEQFNQQSINEQLASQVQAFQSAKNADGTAQYPHFERVRGVMSQLFASGQAQTLADAYEIAVKPINDAVAAELSARQANADKRRADEIAKAKKVNPVRSNGTAPNGATKAKGLDAILGEALDQHGIA